jgi:DNA topoisomerase-1
MTILVIVESPGKIKKIKSYLGSDYNVMASVGHIRDLTKDSISIDVNNNFNPTYDITPDKKQVVSNLRKAAKDVDEIIIASDGDREGEAIAYHLKVVLNLKDDYKRIVFHEITKSAIQKALAEPKLIDMNMFHAQQARRLLDRIVGYKLSPILRSIPNLKSKSLGAGRVQSVVTRIIVDKEKEINTFLNNDKSSTYNITGDFIINGCTFKATYINNNLIEEKTIIKQIKNVIKTHEINTFKMVKAHVDTLDKVKFIIINIKNDTKFNISNVEVSDRLKHPQQPFITSSLQQEASYKLRFPLKKTMTLAQKLYEKGLITYMRTDSPNLSNDSLGYIKKIIIEDKDLGENYYQFRQFKAKNASAQEAHEAIRPTHFNVKTLNEYQLNDTDEEKLYQLIWNRTVASQMKPAKYSDQYIVLTNITGTQFDGTSSTLIFDGYLKLYNDKNDDEDSNDNNDNVSIKINKNSKNNRVEWTKIQFKELYQNPPSRFNEPSLVKKLEGLGIGRPSTYASIITKIQEHNYIKVSNISSNVEKNVNTYILHYLKLNLTKKSTVQKLGNEKTRLVPTEDGISVTDYLVKNFPQIMDYKFTAKMETLLDDIAEGNKVWYDVLKEFYEVLREQFTILNMNIDSNYITNNNNEPNIDKINIGKHPKYGDIIYMVAKYGPVFKVNIKSKKDLFVNAGKCKPTDDNILENAIKMIDSKISYNQSQSAK